MKARCVNIRFFLLISVFLLISHSMHSTSYADITPVSERTSQVRDAIVAAVPNIDAAADVTETHLATIISLNLRAKSISALKSGDFSGLTGLTDLNLYGNQLSSLPNGIFEGLTALTTLRLGGNTVDPMPISVLLQKVADGQFKAVAPIGAPFAIVLPISTTNGSIADSTTSLTIAKGSTESNVVTVSHTADTTAAVTANIGTLPSLPQNHYGYTLLKSSALPVEIISEVVTTTPIVPEPIEPEPIVPEPSTNTAPVFTDGVNTIHTITENTAANINIGSAVPATDADDDTLTYSLSGTDAAAFEIDSSSGQLKTKTTLDYEIKRIYTLIITVSDGNLTDTISVIISVIDVAETTIVSTTLPVSQRTTQVRDAIVAAVPNITVAEDVTATHLSAITSLNLRSMGITALQSGDFAGLSGLTNLNLYGNMLSSLPIGIFEGLTALTILRLGGNAVDPLPISITLQQVTEGQFKAVIPTGAPFDVVVPIGAMMIIIPQGSMESDTFTADASVTLGALPTPPANHFGYILAKSDVCNRTLQVSEAITAAVPGITDCRNITEVHLATITSLNLSSMSITSLKTGDFAGMLSLTTLNLSGNQLTNLPDGIFADLTSLNQLNLSGNSVSPFPLTVSLQKVGSNQIKVVVPTGAPFNITLPISVANGSLSSGTTLTIPTSSVESSTQTITRTSGTTAAVTVDFSSLPNLPSLHSGYGLVKSNQQPLEIFSEINVAPIFIEGTTATRTIAENTAADTNIGTAIVATDANNDTLTYTFSGTDAASFSIDSSSGQLKTKASLDYETNTSYLVIITVSDGSLTDTISVTINVTDVDENRAPEFTDGDSTTRSVAENTGSGVDIGSAVSATDADDDTLTYTLSGTDAASFSIDSSSGQLQTSVALDYETKSSYSVTITVSDGKGGSDSISVTINVTDIDETPATDNTVTTKDDNTPNNAPVFTDGDSTTLTIAENTGSGVDIGSAVSATDEDKDDTLTYTLGGTDASSFSIDSGSGQLKTSATLDYEAKDSYSVTITVSDGKSGSDSISVTINITDVDESAPNNAPTFTDGDSTTRTVAENTASGVDIGSAVSATDDDDGDTLSYSLGGTDESSFSIDSSSGQLRTSAALDYETKTSYSVTNTVSDGKGGSDSISVTINITDVDESPTNNVPTFTDGESTTRTVAENTASGVDIGSAVSATDADDDTLTYSISGTDSASFGIVNTSGQLKTKADLNYETKSSYTVTVSVSDGEGGSDSISVTINVTDVNETPVFSDGTTTTRAISENVGANINIGTAVKAVDPDTDDSLTYTLGSTDAASFAIDNKTGQLKTKTALDFETKSSYSVTVTAKDVGNLTDSITVTINVTNLDETPSNNPPIFDDDEETTREIAENTPADRNIGAPVSATDADSNTLAYVMGGDDASSFSIDLNTGQLKTSAALDHEDDDTYGVTVTVNDGSSTDTISVTISVTDVNEAPVFADDSTTLSVAENTAASTNIGSAITATDPDGDDLTYSLEGSDAASFDIVSTTGQLKTKAALDYEDETSYSVTLKASDDNLSDTISVTINVTDVDENRAPAFVSASTTRSVAENTASGQAIGDPVSATDADTSDTLTYTLGGTDAASFSIVDTSGQLQTNAMLDHETKNSYEVTVTATDNSGASNNSATITVTINVTDVNNAPEFDEGSTTTRSVDKGTYPSKDLGAPVSATDADDDTLTYTLSGTDAALFEIDSTNGQLSNKDFLHYEDKSSYSVTITVSDSKGGTNTITVTITDDKSPAVEILTYIRQDEPPWVLDFDSETGIVSAVIPETYTGYNGRDLDVASFTRPPGVQFDNSFTVAIVFDEEVSGLDQTELTLTENTAGANVTSWEALMGWTGNNTVTQYRAKVEVTQSGTVTFSVAADAATDGSGNSNAEAESKTVTVTITLTEYPPWDVNEDGSVNATDSALVTAALGQTGEDIVNERTDVNWDDTVDADDLTLVTYHIETDVDENRAPTFSGSSISYSITDIANASVGDSIGLPITATDLDDDTLEYSLGGDDASKFTIDSGSGQLKITQVLIDGTSSSYSIEVIATDPDNATAEISGTINVTRIATQVSNSAPEFDGTSTTRSVAENTASEQNIGDPVSATDANTSDTLTYTLGGTDAASFDIVSTSGQLQTKAALDYEDKTSYSVTITVKDGNGGEDSISVTINLTDVDENRAPTFSGSSISYSITDIANTSVGEDIGSPVTATDADNDTLSYSVDGEDKSYFSIVSSSGQLEVTQALIDDSSSSYSIKVIATDPDDAAAEISVTITVTRLVTQQQNTNTAPTFDDGTSTTHSIAENTTSGENIGNPVSATDSDTDDILTYSLEGTDADSFSIVTTSGQLQTSAELDYETKSSYEVTVKATDDSGASNNSATITVTISISDENDAPVFQYGSSVTLSVNKGERLGTSTRATDDDDDALTYSISGTDAALFSFHSDYEDHLQSNAALDYDGKSSYSLTITVSDGNGGSDTITVTITDPAPEVEIWTLIGYDEPDWVLKLDTETGIVRASACDHDDFCVSVTSQVKSSSVSFARPRGVQFDNDFHVAVVFSEEVSGFEQSELTLTDNTAGATISSWQSQGTHFGYVVDANIDVTTSGSVTFNVAAGVATDNGDQSNTAAGSTTFTVTITLTDYPPWDVNQDGSIDATDSDLVTAAFGQTEEAIVNSRTDVNWDDTVDADDVTLVTYHIEDDGGAPSLIGAFSLLDKKTLEKLDPGTLQSYLDILRTENDGSLRYLRAIAIVESVLAAIRPSKTQLLANYPNPFNPETWIPYHLANPSNVRISIYNMQGVVVRSLELGHQPTGYYTSRNRAAYWDGTNDVGERVTSGIYFYQLQADNVSLLRKMLILK